MNTLAATPTGKRAAAAPRPALKLAAKLAPGVTAVILGGVLVGAAVARYDHFAAAPSGPPAIATAALTFTDMADGGVLVRNGITGQLVANIPARDDGFLRMTLRLLAAARLRQHIGQEQPFVLTEFAGGRMKLADPATGLSIELEAFGPSNVGEFQHFFTPVSNASETGS